MIQESVEARGAPRARTIEGWRQPVGGASAGTGEEHGTQRCEGRLESVVWHAHSFGWAWMGIEFVAWSAAHQRLLYAHPKLWACHTTNRVVAKKKCEDDVSRIPARSGQTRPAVLRNFSRCRQTPPNAASGITRFLCTRPYPNRPKSDSVWRALGIGIGLKTRRKPI